MIVLEKNKGEKLGFFLTGDAVSGFIVKTITPNTVADRSELQVGDQILFVNGSPLYITPKTQKFKDIITKEKAIKLIKKAGNRVILTVRTSTNKTKKLTKTNGNSSKTKDLENKLVEANRQILELKNTLKLISQMANKAI
jgi:C-terminal processing protease CtpA/Prc